MRWAEDEHPPDESVIEHRTRDQRGLYCFSDAHVVCNKEPDGVQLKRARMSGRN
jgi:hypothetical protein